MRVSRGRNQKLLGYMQEAVERLLEQDGFENGWSFKKTQREALQAYAKFLNDTKLPPRERMEGYFDIATGVGKTAIFVALVSMANQIAEERGEEFRSVIVVPTKVLLEQTSDEFNDIAPSTDGNIGFYGDRKRTLSKPITIMTYNAWTELSVDKKLSAQNVDLLISDEAHRGTSEERTLISKIFNGVVRLAFTATPEFDPDKAVEHSHKHEIYSKPLPEAVREGELASYIQSQLHIIRARPSKKLKDKFGGEEVIGEVKRRLRQDAWTKWAVRFYREGRDKQTGDLVSDNQAGFFVDDINHAIALRESLNNDPVLKKKAQELGYKDVAIDVHSRKLSKGERKKRIKAYQKGHYMAIIGDEMLKEGFDHKPMKTVVDWPHGSLVDKLQILGRGARKWFNKLKDRWEGLTFADTIVYVGSDDPEEDEALRNKAIRSAILASDILDGEAMVSYPAQKRERIIEEGEESLPVFLDDDDIEEYTSLEAIKTLLAERSELRREHYIEITDEVRQEFQSYQKQTGIGGVALFGYLGISPDGLTAPMAHSILIGETTTALPSHIEVLRSAYEQVIADMKSGKYEKPAPISEQDRKDLAAMSKQVGLGGRAIYNRIKKPPVGLDADKAVNIVIGNSKTAPPSHITALRNAYEQIIADMKSGKYEKPEPISEQDRKDLAAMSKQVGLGGSAIYRRIKNPPEGLNADKASNIVGGGAKKALPSHIEVLRSAYEQVIADMKSEEHEKPEPISEQDREDLAAMSKQVGLSGHAIYGHIKNPPEGLDVKVSDYIIANRAMTALPSHITALRNAYEQIIADMKSGKYEKPELISEQDRKDLTTFFKQTGLSGRAIYGRMKSPPEGLNADKAKNIVSGGAKKALPSHITALRNAYEQIIADMKSGKYEKPEPISEQDRKDLAAFVKKTGMKGSIIYQRMNPIPQGMTRQMAESIVRGKIGSAYPSHVNAVKKVYEEVIEEIESGQAEVPLPISSKDANSLKVYAKQTGLGGSAIFSRIKNPPEGLNRINAGSIVSGGHKSVKPSYLKAIFDTYNQVLTELENSSERPRKTQIRQELS